jgi:biopolymer transport protein ExbD
MDLLSAMLLVLSIIIVSTIIAYYVQKGSNFPKPISEEKILKELKKGKDINVSITPKGDVTFKEQANDTTEDVAQTETAKPKKKRKYYPKKKKVQE